MSIDESYDNWERSTDTIRPTQAFRAGWKASAKEAAARLRRIADALMEERKKDTGPESDYLILQSFLLNDIAQSFEKEL